MPRRNITNGYYALRWKILERDKFTCQYCGQSAPNVKLEVDHIIPCSDGGRDEEDNLTTSCYACNRGKSTLSIITTRRRSGDSPIVRPRFYVATTQDNIYRLLETSGEKTAKEIASTLALTENGVRVALSRLFRKGKVCRGEYRKYQVVPPS
ncbi:MAG: HNH endonuclease [Proteobacteria bacterium]|nr:HNH endonuclease [Pseudomonadota bacterium]